MLDIAAAYNRYRFLGNQFLTWLWFMMETDQAGLRNLIPDLTALYVGSRMVLENTKSSNKETITIKGDDANLDEGRLALQKGALVTELHLSYKAAAQNWQFSIKGESLNISNLKLPETGPMENPEEIEGRVLEKIYLVEQVAKALTLLFTCFIKLRLSNDWPNKVKHEMRKWAAS